LPTNADNVLGTEELRVAWRADAIPLDELQVAFADLFERAAYVVQCKGYEQDDTIVDRFLLCRNAERTYVVEASFISDGRLLVEQLKRDLRVACGGAVELSNVTVVGLRVVTILDAWPEVPGVS
jgi:hypothetical protein